MDGYTYGEGGRTNALQAPINRLVTMVQNAIIHQHITEEAKRFLSTEDFKWVFGEFAMYLCGESSFEPDAFTGTKKPSPKEIYLIRMIEQHTRDVQGYEDKCATLRANGAKGGRPRKEEAPAPSPMREQAAPQTPETNDRELILELMVYCITMQWSDPYKKACAAVEYNNRTEWKKLQPGQRKYDYCKGYFTLKGYDKDKPSPYGPLLHLLVMREIGMSRESIRIVSEGISGMDRVGDTLLVNTKSPEASSILQAVMLDDTKKAYILQHYKASIPYKDIKIA